MRGTDDRRPGGARLVAALGVACGAVLLARPHDVLDRLAPAFPEDRRPLVRVLGARLVLQHGAVLVAPDRRLIRLGSGIDLLHAASMVPFVASPRYGRAARLSAGLAAISAAVALVVARRG